MRLSTIPTATYLREVLPLTAPLWAGRRDFDTYANHTQAVARSSYGRRHFRTIGLLDGDTIVASFKRYERAMHEGTTRLQAVGLGAVFTPPERRGRGYASVMIASELDRSRAEGFDLAYLFSDVRPQFYADLGFKELPSRHLTLRADTLPAERIKLARAMDDDWTGIARCYDLCERARPAGFLRTTAVWDWMRLRASHGSEHDMGQETNLVVRRGRGVASYVLGVRAPERDAYVVDEFGFADAAAARTIPSLLRAAAGDLQRISGWLPPPGARELLPAGAVRKRRGAVLMMAPLSPAGKHALQSLVSDARADACWATDHI